ncbi:unnamed protein product [Vitrella brassicaformis CCMP3155]|uniref:Kinesin motor domain-containing protein n=3 Tax=Vitrella brassicaformis TaxID=1169539 RepID=A0A0G4H109_VITBC|nr:unnamed protein product [Vitrella brassicaformis CCMP3155]|eukprot:CEM37179.1 unnamed protein product [Vitrella brassicaformis CCMP3155]
MLQMEEVEGVASAAASSANPWSAPVSSGGSEQVRVAVRVRPLSPKEILERCRECVRVFPETNQIVIGRDKTFTYDDVYNATDTQEVVANTTANPLVEGLFEGLNATILAYGQTGAGKTYTMSGVPGSSILSQDSETLGIIPRAVNSIFRCMYSSKREDIEFMVKCSYVELHNEDFGDLLDTSYGAKNKAIMIREDTSGQQILLGVKEVEVKKPSEVLRCLEKGNLNRTTGTTLMNEYSSRSHAVFTVTIEQALPDDKFLSAKCRFVDLAGSERVKKTGTVGQRFREGININQGLLALGNVISVLGDPAKRGQHVPYRDSKLTRLLQDSLGGNSRTVMVACISPADSNFSESLNTLVYANRARNIKNKPIVNQDPHTMEIARLKAQIQELQLELLKARTIVSPNRQPAVPPAGLPGAPELPAATPPFAGLLGGEDGDDLSPSVVRELREEVQLLQAQNKSLQEQVKESVEQVEELQEKLTQADEETIRLQARLAWIQREKGGVMVHQSVLNEDQAKEVIEKHLTTINEFRKKVRHQESLLAILTPYPVGSDPSCLPFIPPLAIARGPASLRRSRSFPPTSQPKKDTHSDPSMPPPYSPPLAGRSALRDGVGDWTSSLESELIDAVLQHDGQGEGDGDGVEGGGEADGEAEAHAREDMKEDHEFHLSQRQMNWTCESLEATINEKLQLINKLMKNQQAYKSMKQRYELRLEELEEQLSRTIQDKTALSRELEVIQTELESHMAMGDVSSVASETVNVETQTFTNPDERAIRPAAIPPEVASKDPKAVQRMSRLEEEKARLQGRLQELNSRIVDLKQQQREAQRIVRLKTQQDTQLRQLHQDVSRMKAQQDALQVRMRYETDRYREWKKKWQDKVAQLRKEADTDKKKAYDLMKTTKQQETIIKRKTQEVSTMTQKLQLMKNRGLEEELQLSKKRHWIEAQAARSRRQKEAQDRMKRELEEREAKVKALEGMYAERAQLLQQRPPKQTSLQPKRPSTASPPHSLLSRLPQQQQQQGPRRSAPSSTESGGSPVPALSIQLNSSKGRATVEKEASQSRLRSLNESIGAIECEIAFRSDRIADVQQEIAENEEEGMVSEGRVAAAMAALEEGGDESEMRATVVALTESVDAMQEECGAYRSRVSELEADLMERETEVRELKQQLANAETAHQETITSLQSAHQDNMLAVLSHVDESLSQNVPPHVNQPASPSPSPSPSPALAADELAFTPTRIKAFAPLPTISECDRNDDEEQAPEEPPERPAPPARDADRPAPLDPSALRQLVDVRGRRIRELETHTDTLEQALKNEQVLSHQLRQDLVKAQQQLHEVKMRDRRREQNWVRQHETIERDSAGHFAGQVAALGPKGLVGAAANEVDEPHDEDETDNGVPSRPLHRAPSSSRLLTAEQMGVGINLQLAKGEGQGRPGPSSPSPPAPVPSEQSKTASISLFDQPKSLPSSASAAVVQLDLMRTPEKKKQPTSTRVLSRSLTTSSIDPSSFSAPRPTPPSPSRPPPAPVAPLPMASSLPPFLSKSTSQPLLDSDKGMDGHPFFRGTTHGLKHARDDEAAEARGTRAKSRLTSGRMPIITPVWRMNQPSGSSASHEDSILRSPVRPNPKVVHRGSPARGTGGRGGIGAVVAPPPKPLLGGRVAARPGGQGERGEDESISVSELAKKEEYLRQLLLQVELPEHMITDLDRAVTRKGERERERERDKGDGSDASSPASLRKRWEAVEERIQQVLESKKRVEERNYALREKLEYRWEFLGREYEKQFHESAITTMGWEGELTFKREIARLDAEVESRLEGARQALDTILTTPSDLSHTSPAALQHAVYTAIAQQAAAAVAHRTANGQPHSEMLEQLRATLSAIDTSRARLEVQQDIAHKMAERDSLWSSAEHFERDLNERIRERFKGHSRGHLEEERTRRSLVQNLTQKVTELETLLAQWQSLSPYPSVDIMWPSSGNGADSTSAMRRLEDILYSDKTFLSQSPLHLLSVGDRGLPGLSERGGNGSASPSSTPGHTPLCGSGGANSPVNLSHSRLPSYPQYKAMSIIHDGGLLSGPSKQDGNGNGNGSGPSPSSSSSSSSYRRRLSAGLRDNPYDLAPVSEDGDDGGTGMGRGRGTGKVVMRGSDAPHAVALAEEGLRIVPMDPLPRPMSDGGVARRLSSLTSRDSDASDGLGDSRGGRSREDDRQTARCT